MKRLTLIRHAKSDWNSAAATDFERPLNGRGKKAAPLMGERLAKRGAAPDLLLSSPAKRARQTAKRIAKELDYPAEEIEYAEEIYEASLGTLVDLLQQLDEQHREVMLIGHNPGFSDLGQWLNPAAPDWLPTCGLLELELPVERWQDASEACATLKLYDYPKKAI